MSNFRVQREAPMKFSNVLIVKIVFFVLVLSWGTTECFAAPLFYSTSDPVNHWFVSTNVAGVDGLGEAGFNTTNFIQAVTVNPPRGDGLPYIADDPTGTHSWQWTYFVFRQTFDLTGYDPTTADLKFQWAADDSGEIYATRGSWIPQFRLNGGAFTYYPGSSPENRIPTYGYSSVVDLTSGFVSGLNTIDFYVEGNGMTDGFALGNVVFTADPANPVPEPSTIFLLGAGLAGVAFLRRRTKL